MVKVGFRRLHVVFVPRHMHARMAIHTGATLAGALLAVRLGWGAPLWAGLAWYFVAFVGFHIVLCPFMLGYYLAANRLERWVRGIVEEELIKFDMKGYEKQLQRLIPALNRSAEDD